jgi:hypothetical protein
MRQLDGQALVGERRDDVLDDRLGRLHADRAEAQAPVDRHEPFVGPVGEVELVLERRVERQPLRGRRGDLSLEEVARVEGPRLVVQLDHVDHHLAAARGVRQHDERLGVRHEPDLADRPVRRVRASVSMLVNDCMPFTRPIPLAIRRARAFTWVLLPRMTPPLSQ